MPGAVEELVRDLDRYRDATRRVQNRAVFELPGILHGDDGMIDRYRVS